jgi:metal-sulfur cluster biosynthetic enzyme
MTSEELTTERVRQLLNEIIDPCSAAKGVPIGLTDMGLVRGVTVTSGKVDLQLRVTGPGCMMFLDFERRARELLREHGATAVRVDWDPTPDWTPADIEPSARERLTDRRNLLGLAARASV